MEIETALKILYPSNIKIYNVFHVQLINNELYFAGYKSYYYKPRESDNEDLYKYSLEIESEEIIPEINRFLKLFHDWQPMDYIKRALDYYLSSFDVNFDEMKFLALCISLETVVDTSEQLTYRFKRNLAILCGGSEITECRTLFKNINKLYTIRSQIVHSGPPIPDQNFLIYFNFAQLLCSRMILEMLLHSIPTINKLNELLTESGFGQAHLLSVNYQSCLVNNSNWMPYLTSVLARP